jgi:hypothetical protein
MEIEQIIEAFKNGINVESKAYLPTIVEAKSKVL